MLEWYVAGFDYQQLMSQCEELIISVADDLGFAGGLAGQAGQINLASPWERITVQEAFETYAPVTLDEALSQDRFDEILVEYIEPNLGLTKPAFLYDYPARLGALARLKQSDQSVAERFELYIGGLELANGFSELTDAGEQRQRFVEALETPCARKLCSLSHAGKIFSRHWSKCPQAPVSLSALTVWRCSLRARQALMTSSPFPPEIL